MRNQVATNEKVDEAFQIFKLWRKNLIKALLTDCKSFQKLHSEERYCSRGIRLLKQWEVYLPDEPELLAGLPPSTMRLNFTCNDMGEYIWLYILTTHCDAWLLSVALNSGGLGEIGRRSLFKKINNLPTIRDVVSEVAKTKVRDNKSKSNSEVGDEDEDEDEFEFEEGDEDMYALCDACGDYASCVFWIWCDTCEKDTIRCNCNSCSPEDKCKSCKNKFAMVVRRPRQSLYLLIELYP